MTVDLRGRRAGTHRVAIRLRTAGGASVTLRRTYRTCVPAAAARRPVRADPGEIAAIRRSTEAALRLCHLRPA